MTALRQRPRLLTSLRCGIVLCTALLLALGLVWLTTPSVQAATCNVPGSYATIQSAVDDNTCDGIVVAAGVYTDPVVITRTMVITGAGTTQTILDGNNTERPLSVSGAGVEVRVSALAVRNGDASASPPTLDFNARLGGGIVVYDQAKLWLNGVSVYDNVAKSVPTVGGFGGGIGVWDGAALHATEVSVYQNRANTSGGSGFGGGIAVLAATAYITDSEVLTNTAKFSNTSGQARGGGIYIARENSLSDPQSAYLTLTGSLMAGNFATNANQIGYGGGLYVGEANMLRVWSRDNTWRDNVARQVTSGDAAGQGGAIAADISTAGPDVRLNIEDDIFYRNVANPANDLTGGSRADGGALFLDANDPGYLRAVISNTTFYSNTAQPSSSGSDVGEGGAIRARHSDLAIYGSKLYSNTARATGTSRGGAIRLESTVFTMTHSIVRDNTADLGAAIFSTNGAATPGRLNLLNDWIVNNNGTSSIYQLHDNPTPVDSYAHVTLAGDTTGYGIALAKGQIAVTNTLVTSYAIGINNTGGIFTGSHVLFFDNGTPEVGASPANPLSGDPRFVNPQARDYHIQPVSAARDVGLDIGVADDIDRQPRDANPDVGADEYSTFVVTEPIEGLSISGPPTRTVGSAAYFTATVTAGTNISYTWDFGNSAVGSGNPVSYTYNTVGTYTVTVTGTNSIGSAVAFRAIQVTSTPPSDTPITGLTAQNNSPMMVNETVLLTASVSAGDNISYTWSYGDGSSGSGINTSHVYTKSGVYTATVTAVNDASTRVATTTVYIGDAVVEVGPNFTNTYSPKDVVIGPGDTVVWVLRTGNHSVTAQDNRFKEQPLGTNWPPHVVTFNSTGVYPYYCVLHGTAAGFGMAGTVTVTGSGPGPKLTPRGYLPLVDE